VEAYGSDRLVGPVSGYRKRLLVPARSSTVITQPTQVATRQTAATPRNLPVRRPALGAKPTARALFDLHTSVLYVQSTLAGSPLATIAVLPGIVATAGKEVLLKHQLGRVPQGWHATDGQGRNFRGLRVAPAAGTIGPSGSYQEADYLTIMALETGTYTFLVF
jgi:hypothetical protein